MTKRHLRQELRARRRQVGALVRATAAAGMRGKLLARADVRAAMSARRPIAVYVATSEELDLSGFIADALTQGAVLVAPRWNGNVYELVPFEDVARLVPGPHGILEPPQGQAVQPSQVAVWLVPGLAFTRDGKRLGYGGGWYDRMLDNAAPDAAVIGIGYAFQVVPDLPSEPHDVKMSTVVVF